MTSDALIDDMIMTPQEYGVGARFTLAVYDTDYIRIITDALEHVDRGDLIVDTGDISTFLTGSEQDIVGHLGAVIGHAARTGTHVSAAILLSRGCPGELECELPPGVPALGACPVALDPTGIRARAHWSLYPLMASADERHMDHIHAAIDRARRSGVFSGSDHFASRLDGDLATVLTTAANAWIDVGHHVQHVVSHLTISINSPTPIPEP